MRIASGLLFFLCLLLGLTWSCTQAVTIGSDFLDDQKNDLLFADNFTLTFNTEKTDSVVTYSPNVSYQLITYLVGNLQDPVFGHSTSEIYTQPQLPVQGTDLIGSTLDSVVLQLRYDTLGLYGDLSSPVTLEVYQLSETPNYLNNYYSNVHFEHNPDLLGSVTFVPHPKDSITVTNAGDTIKSAPHIRIPLNVARFADLLLQDTVVFTHQDSFQNYFHGLYIKMTGANNTMLGISLLNSLSGMVFYYDTPVEENHIFKLVFTTGRVNCTHMEHDYTGSPVEAALAPEPESNYWYIQGMTGVRSKMKIEGLDLLPKAVINQVVLEVYATFPDGDNEGFYPPCPFMVTQDQTDSTLNYDNDVRIALAVAQGNHFSSVYDLLFGGKLGERNPGPPVVYKYEMKLTNRIKDILEGNKENILYFNPFSKSDFPDRAVLFGPNDPIYAPRLRVYYTVI
jgi:hypothetical protein